jgi:AsmA protein
MVKGLYLVMFSKGKIILRRILFAAAAIVLVAVGLFFTAPLFISTEHLQSRALSQVESATGYRVRIDGPVKIAFFPSVDLIARDVGIAQPDRGGAAEFATARTVRFGLVLRSLLAGKVNLTEVTLVDPVIKLPLPEQAEDRAPDSADETKGPAQGLSIHTLNIRNGTLVLAGEDGAPGSQITALNAQASLPRARGPLSFDATAQYDGDPVAVAGTIGSFAHFLDAGSVPVKLALTTPDLPEGATLTGAASYKEGALKLIDFDAKSGPHRLSGNATYGDDTLTITQGLFDDMPFAGSASFANNRLTTDAEIAIDGKPIRFTGSLDRIDEFSAGGAMPITLQLVAPDYVKDDVTLNGLFSYKDDVLALPKFTAVVGADTITGAAEYKDTALTLSQVTARVGDQTISGDATYRDDTVNVDVALELERTPAKVTGSITGIAKLLAGEPAPVELEIESPDRLPAKAVVTGDAVYKDDAVSLTAFTAVSGPYTVTGNGVLKDNLLVLDPVTMQTKDQTVSGALTANLGGDVPSLTGALTATGAVKSTGGVGAPKELPQTRTRPETASATVESAPNPLGQPPGSGTEVAIAPPPGPEGKATPKEKLRDGVASLRDGAASLTAPKKTAPKAGGSGWRSETLGLSTLKAVNADLTVTLSQFKLGDIKISAATVKTKIAGGKLTAQSTDLKAYGGGGTMTLVLNASGAVPAHRLDLSVSGLDAGAFLNDVADFRTIEGKAAISLALAASGNSERALVSSLNGTAKFEFTNGALRGLNVARMLRNLTTGILTGWQYRQDTKTAFNTLGASFKVSKGQAQTDDLRLLGPLVSIGGAGTVDIPAQRLKFRVNPFMLASVEGQGGKNNLLGFPVPIVITGPWDNPSIYPDIVGVLDNPVAAYEQLNKLGGGLVAMPANMLGINTGEGGLVEKSIAIPEAVTKGVVGGLGQMLGGKKQKDPKAMQPAPAEQPGDGASAANAAAPKQPAPQTPQENKSAPNPPASQRLRELFGQ